jgi:hypothetical protein
MQFKSLLFSFLLVLTLGFALLTQAEDSPRGPKITNKVRDLILAVLSFVGHINTNNLTGLLRY